MKELPVLNREEIMKAFESAFDKGIYLNHKPTEEDFIYIRLRAVAQRDADKERING